MAVTEVYQFSACDHSIASVLQKEVCSLWISLVQSPSINTQSQKARGIWSSNETHPDAPCSSGQTQIKKTTRPFYHCPLTRPKSPALVRKVVTLVLIVFTVLCNFWTHRHLVHPWLCLTVAFFRVLISSCKKEQTFHSGYSTFKIFIISSWSIVSADSNLGVYYRFR